jgi:hypothetical protein
MVSIWIRVTAQRPDLVAKAIKPDYALGNDTASLGLAFSTGAFLPERYRHGAFIGQHGSWNRKPRSGYKVIFVPFSDGRPSGLPVDVLTGFVSVDEEALGRPVGVAIDRAGALLVADDVGNRVWRVGPAAQKAATGHWKWLIGISAIVATKTKTMLAVTRTIPRAERGTGALTITVDGHWNSRMAGNVGSSGSDRRLIKCHRVRRCFAHGAAKPPGTSRGAWPSFSLSGATPANPGSRISAWPWKKARAVCGRQVEQAALATGHAMAAAA